MKEEDWLQINLIRWIKNTYPDILFTASAGGMRTHIKTAKKMKAMGYVAGCPDLMIFEPRGGYHGLMIELKTERGKKSENQIKFIESLIGRDYFAVFCYGLEHAQMIIKQYMELK